MYTVYIERECGCFKKSEYESEKSFDKQQEAYQYANVLAEFMNEDFCSKHLFTARKTVDNDFIIAVEDNHNAGSCGTGGSSAGSCSSGSCGC